MKMETSFVLMFIIPMVFLDMCCIVKLIRTYQKYRDGEEYLDRFVILLGVVTSVYCIGTAFIVSQAVG